MRIPNIPYHQGRNNYVDGDGLHFGIAIHNTSNTASDTNEASYADHRTDGTSSHFYVDKDSVTQSLDTDRKAGHAGSSEGNNNAIAFELTGTNDRSRQWWLDNIAWPTLGYVIAYIIRNDPDYRLFQVRRASVAEMKSNPKVKAFYSHDDMRRAWGGTTHDDPGPNFPWDRLLSAVNTALNPASAAAEEPTVPTYSTANPNAGENIEAQVSALMKLLPVQVGTLPAGNVKGMAAEPFPMPNTLAGTLTTIASDAAAAKVAAQAGGWTQQQREDLAEDLATRAFDKLAAKFGDALLNALIDPRAIEAFRQGANLAEDS